MTLFKYVVPERLDILEKGLVRFTHPSALNDLLELRPAFNRLLTPEDTKKYLDENPLDVDDIARRAHEELPAHLRAEISPAEMNQFTRDKLASAEGVQAFDAFADIALTMMNSFAPKLRGLMYENLDQLVGVLSLSESWDNAPMWAHYASNHSGFVIGFDDSHPFFHRRRTEHDEFYHVRKVVYSDNPPVPRAFRDLGDAASVFLTKESRWSYEQERRMLAPLTDATITAGSPEDPIHLFSIPPDLIQSVIFGVRSAEALVQKVQQIAWRPGSPLSHVRLLRVAVDEDRGGLKLIPVNTFATRS